MITSGMGRHVSCLSSQSVISMLEFSAISEALNVIGIGVVKVSVCLTLLRVVERGRRRISQCLWCLLVFVAITHLALAMLFFLHCRPLAALWNPRVPGSCLSLHTTVLAGYIGFAIDVVTDLVCAGIPILVIHRLQMNIRTKVALCMLMGLGVFTAGCAVGKAITLRGVFADDFTLGFTKPATWGAVEQFVGIIIASVPALRPLFSSLFEKPHILSRIVASTRRYFLRGSRSAGSGSHEISQRQQPQSLGSNPAMQGSTESKKKLLSGYKKALDQTNSILNQSPKKAIEQECANSSMQEADMEKGLTAEDFYEDRDINYLSAWSPPDIADRGSAMFSIPLPFV